MSSHLSGGGGGRTEEEVWHYVQIITALITVVVATWVMYRVFLNKPKVTVDLQFPPQYHNIEALSSSFKLDLYLFVRIINSEKRPLSLTRVFVVNSDGSFFSELEVPMGPPHMVLTIPPRQERGITIEIPIPKTLSNTDFLSLFFDSSEGRLSLPAHISVAV